MWYTSQHKCLQPFPGNTITLICPDNHTHLLSSIQNDPVSDEYLMKCLLAKLLHR